MSRQKKIEARYAAYKRLAEARAAEFHSLMAEEYSARGLEYVRPLTEEERALATVRELIARFPSLQGIIAPVVVTSSGMPRVPTVDEHLGAEPGIDDDAELPPDHNL
jgi:hypothetical protein